jgi:hypothetical protein
MREGYSIIFLDEAVFTAKHTTESCWQPPGRAGFYQLSTLDQRCVASIAAIELRVGKVLHRETLTAFTHADVISFLRDLDITLRTKKRIIRYSILLDNASIHRSSAVI